MSMTREEATEILRKRQRYCKVIADHANATVKADELREIEAIDISLSALRPVSREQVEKVWRGEWERIIDPYGKLEGFICKCGTQTYSASNFCPHCGGAKTDEAVQMVMERINEIMEEMKYEH